MGFSISPKPGSAVSVAILNEYLTYTKNLIQFNLTIEDGYTFSRFNPIIDSGYTITIDSGGEFVVL
jgi:hypothetical protein